MTDRKTAKNRSNKDISMASEPEKDVDVKSFIDKVFGDVSKTSATQQLVFGASSGWITGFLFMRIGKVVAVALGGSIILLQIANEKGYIKINWDKIEQNLDKVADNVEEKVTGQGRNWFDKAEKFIDRKLDRAEDKLKKHQDKAKSWYSRLTGEESYKLKKTHIFFVSFVAGIAIGIGTA